MTLKQLREALAKLDGVDDNIRITSPLISGSNDKLIDIVAIDYGTDKNRRHEGVLIVKSVLDRKPRRRT